jgi:uncharacterized membrane protein YphA (DoxX/SURF4 family)
VDSRRKLELERLKDDWAADMARIGNHFGFDGEQQKKAGEALAETQKTAEDWFQSPDNRERVKKYLDELAEVEAIERNPNALSYEIENARADRKVAEADRKALVKEVDAWTADFRDDLTKLATPEQFKEAGEYVPPMTQLQQVDLITMWGLSAVGLCMMLGLFTPLACLGGAAYLLSFYLSMPPWPGLPEGITEGHYRFVNKNLIEMLACLVLASTPNGLWIGLDALLFGWIGRPRRTPAEPDEEPRRAERPAPQDRRKFKSR